MCTQLLAFFISWKLEVVSERALTGLKGGRPAEICFALFMPVKSFSDLSIECE